MSDRRPAWAKDSVMLRMGATAEVDLSPAWAFDGATGAGVRVAIVDSGIEADHPLLEGCVDGERGVAFSVADDGTVVVEEGPHPDVFGHGTACAGIIHSLAPQARITSVRVLGPNLSGKAAAFHAGLLWAVEQGFDVINLSLGTTKKDWALAFHEVCDQGYFSNSFIVTAANNVARASYPSLFASVASVACNTTSDPRRFHANPEPPTEFLARGIDVEVAWIGGTTNRSTGNSYAAPHIAGLAALLRSKHPELRPFQVKAALWATAANVLEAGGDEVGPVDAAGRRSTMHATGLRSTSMRSTGMRSTSMRSASVPTAGPSDQRAPENTESATSEAAVAAAAQLPHQAPLRPASETIVRAEDRALSPTVVPIRSDSHVQAGSLADDERRRLLGSMAHPHLRPLDDALLGRRPLGPILDGSQAVSPEVEMTTPTWRVAAAVATASAIAALHRAGVVHGGLRPSDLTLDEFGSLRVGGAERSNGATPRGARVGGAMSVRDLRYVAPEQLRDEAVSAATDVQTLGLILCELLTGRLPYPDVDRVGDLLRQRLTTAPSAVADVGAGMPSAVAAVLDRALLADPVQRQPSAVELAASLFEGAAACYGSDALLLAGPLSAVAVAELRVARITNAWKP